MKMIRIFSLIVVIIMIFPFCKEETEDDNTEQTADYNTEATINITYPGVYSFSVEGTTHTESDGNAFTSISDFTMGQTQINDVEVDGFIQGGQVNFINKQFLLVFPILGGEDTIREEVTFSTGPVAFGGSNINGTGTIILRMIEDTATERGTFTYTLAKKSAFLVLTPDRFRNIGPAPEKSIFGNLLR